MVLTTVKCPHCGSEDVVRNGKSLKGKQRFLCRNMECPHSTFLLDYSQNIRKKGVREQIAQMAINGSGIRDTARVLGIDKNTVMNELKKTNLSSKT